MNLFAIDMQDIKRLSEGIEKCFPDAKHKSLLQRGINRPSIRQARGNRNVSLPRATIADFTLLKKENNAKDRQASSTSSDPAGEADKHSEVGSRRKVTEADFLKTAKYNQTLKNP